MDHNSCNVKRERRLYPRIELLLPVKLLCQNGEVMLGETINVSPFGIKVRIETSKKSHHMTSDVVGVDFGPPGEADAQMSARAEVVRNCSSDKNDLALQVINPPDFCMAPSLIGKHPSLNHIKKRLMKMAGCDLTVLVTGESGTGKNRVAEVIHRYSQRKDKKFLRLNCPSIPESLFESQLFGAEKGAYTGASSPKPGLFRMGDGGTLLLDEISSLPLSLQAKLLQVIEDKSFYPVGASSPIRVDCRIIACTNENMGELVKKNKFREDLYYRLVEAKVHIPPLRKRKSDIPSCAIILCVLIAGNTGKTTARLMTNFLKCSCPVPGMVM